MTVATVLEIGGGIGVIGVELLRQGASRAVLADASPANLEVAREEASNADLLDRWEIVAADFVRRADSVDDADIVTLDRSCAAIAPWTACVSSQRGWPMRP